MQFRERLKNDDSAVSPVIGVILMVAITVILAAVIASFVLGLGPDTATTPSASFSSEVDSSASPPTLDITMSSGTTIDPNNLEVSGDNIQSTGGDIDSDGVDPSAINEVSAGTTITVHFTSGYSGDYSVSLIYVDGDTSSTMQTFEGTV